MVWIARVFGALLLVLAGAAMAGETRGTAEAAQAMVARAIAAYDAQGKAAFRGDECAEHGISRPRSLCIRGRARQPDAGAWPRCQPGRPRSRPDDRFRRQGLRKEMVEKADEKGVWIDYTWRDPLTGKDTQKSSWVIRHDGYIFGCGIYKP